eukprot:85126-Pleurochrysis_carterae.AAC.4
MPASVAARASSGGADADFGVAVDGVVVFAVIRALHLLLRPLVSLFVDLLVDLLLHTHLHGAAARLQPLRRRVSCVPVERTRDERQQRALRRVGVRALAQEADAVQQHRRLGCRAEHQERRCCDMSLQMDARVAQPKSAHAAEREEHDAARCPRRAARPFNRNRRCEQRKRDGVVQEDQVGCLQPMRGQHPACQQPFRHCRH